MLQKLFERFLWTFWCFNLATWIWVTMGKLHNVDILHETASCKLVGGQTASLQVGWVFDMEMISQIRLKMKEGKVFLNVLPSPNVLNLCNNSLFYLWFTFVSALLGLLCNTGELSIIAFHFHLRDFVLPPITADAVTTHKTFEWHKCFTEPSSLSGPLSIKEIQLSSWHRPALK